VAKKTPTLALTKAIRDRFTKSPAAKTLQDEIALARFTVETLVNTADNGHNLYMRAPAIDSLLNTIERLVDTNDRLNRSVGSHLKK
jgi:hypothetical protein